MVLCFQLYAGLCLPKSIENTQLKLVIELRRYNAYIYWYYSAVIELMTIAISDFPTQKLFDFLGSGHLSE